ncbi:MAG: hypothetical protein K0Q74_1675 [Gammaproteobacteria bacterium]|nr:hypothetical protein [Gammaproteobacteria bacterium]
MPADTKENPESPFQEETLQSFLQGAFMARWEAFWGNSPDAQRLQEDIDKLNKLAGESAQNTAALIDRLEQLRSALAASQDQISQLKNSKRGLLGNIQLKDKLLAKAQAASRETEKLEQVITQLKKQIENLQKSNAKLSRQIRENQSTYHSLNEQFTTQELILKDITSSLKEQTQKSESLEEAYQSIAEEIELKDEQIKKLKENLIERDAEIARLTSGEKFESLQKTKQKLKEENIRLQQDVNNLRETVSSLEQRNLAKQKAKLSEPAKTDNKKHQKSDSHLTIFSWKLIFLTGMLVGYGIGKWNLKIMPSSSVVKEKESIEDRKNSNFDNMMGRIKINGLSVKRITIKDSERLTHASTSIDLECTPTIDQPDAQLKKESIETTPTSGQQVSSYIQKFQALYKEFQLAMQSQNDIELVRIFHKTLEAARILNEQTNISSMVIEDLNSFNMWVYQEGGFQQIIALENKIYEAEYAATKWKMPDNSPTAITASSLRGPSLFIPWVISPNNTNTMDSEHSDFPDLPTTSDLSPA